MFLSVLKLERNITKYGTILFFIKEKRPAATVTKHSGNCNSARTGFTKMVITPSS
mgnify:CR=1 FL=1